MQNDTPIAVDLAKSVFESMSMARMSQPFSRTRVLYSAG